MQLESPQSPLSFTMKTSRAALALNNTGVSLLELGCFKESLSTLMDSVEIMKLVLVFEAEAESTGRTSLVAQQHADDTVDTRLDMASKRIAVCQKKMNPKDATTNTTTEGPTEMSCLDDDDIGMIKAAGNYASSSAIAFPIRLRGNNDSINDNACLIDLQASVISYNRGLACLLAYEQKRRQGQEKLSSSKLLVAAFKFFSFAHAMMIQYLKASSDNEQQQSSSSQPDQQHEKLRALLIIRLILGKLFQVIRYQDRSQRQIQGVLGSLALLDDAVNYLEKALLMGGGSIFVSITSASHHMPTMAPAA